MNRSNYNSKRLVLALVAAAFSGALVASAQPEADPPARPPRPADELRQASWPPAERPLSGLQIGHVLTEEQRPSWREALQAQREEMRVLMEKLREARRALIEASLAEKFDEQAIRKHAEAIGKIEADLAVLRAKAIAKIRPPLTPEQREKLKTPPPAMREHMLDEPPPRSPRGGERPLRGPRGGERPPVPERREPAPLPE